MWSVPALSVFKGLITKLCRPIIVSTLSNKSAKNSPARILKTNTQITLLISAMGTTAASFHPISGDV